jgi:hypothetical protein
MKRRHRKLLNLFALLLLVYALYLSFFSKDEPDNTVPPHLGHITKN